MVNKAVPVDNSRQEGLPSTDYYCRETREGEPFGPLTYYQSHEYSRRASMLNVSGLMEVYVIVGERAGDPSGMVPHEETITLFRRGKALVAGKVADFISRHHLPPGA